MNIYKTRNRPRRGEQVWVEGHKPQPNGRVVSISYGTDEVTVLYYAGGIEVIALDKFLGNMEKNCWMIYANEEDPAFHEEQRLDVHIFFDLCLEDNSKTYDEKIDRLILLSKYMLKPRKYVVYEYADEKRLEILRNLVEESECGTNQSGDGGCSG